MSLESGHLIAPVKSAREVIEGLMEIAEVAMPDSYFESDSRTRAAREWLDRDSFRRVARDLAPKPPELRPTAESLGYDPDDPSFGDGTP